MRWTRAAVGPSLPAQAVRALAKRGGRHSKEPWHRPPNRHGRARPGHPAAPSATTVPRTRLRSPRRGQGPWPPTPPTRFSMVGASESATKRGLPTRCDKAPWAPPPPPSWPGLTRPSSCPLSDRGPPDWIPGSSPGMTRWRGAGLTTNSAVLPRQHSMRKSNTGCRGKAVDSEGIDGAPAERAPDLDQ